MPTVIDSLVVELGLDPAQFTPKTKQAIDDLNKLEAANEKRSKGAVEGARHEGEALRGLKTQAIELFAIFTGITGIKDFITGTIQAGATVGRLSRAIGVSATEISKWQGVALEFGSTGENMANAFQSLSNVFTAWQVNGPEAPQIMQMFRIINAEAERLDANNAKVIDGTKGVSAALMATAANLKIIHDLSADKNRAAYLAKFIPGMDAGLFDLLIQGNEKVAASLQKVQGYTDSEAEAAGRLQRRWDALKVSAGNLGMKLLFGTIDTAKYYLATPPDGQKPSTFTQPSVNSAPVSGGFTSPAQIEAYIRSAAIRRGQNPDVWVKTWTGEGRRSYTGDPDATGAPTSFGPLQLHFAGVGRNTADGLGPIFQKQTGLDPRDPATMRQQIDWSMDWAKSHGMSDWHGWKGSQFANMSGGGSSSSTTVAINGPITVNGIKDPQDFVSKLRDLGLRLQADGNQSSVGGE